MILLNFFYVMLISFSFIVGQCRGELFTLAGLGLGAALGYYKWDFFKDNTYCQYNECCNVNYVPYDITKLYLSFKARMFGQPLVTPLYNILSAHKEAIISKRNHKALVVSFHGWSGVGKNYAAQMIAEAIFEKGMKSKFVEIIMGKKDFNDCSDKRSLRRKLLEKVVAVVKKCPSAVIIIDEVDEICPDVLDILKPMLDSYHAVDGVDFRDSVFVFISNIGGNEITEKLLELYGQGIQRDDVQFHNFEPYLRRAAFYQGGFEQSSTITHQLIDHYIPFLPLEQKHVEQCALQQFKENGVHRPTQAMMDEALAAITYGPTDDQPIFANNGCKRLPKRIPYVIQKFKT